MEKLNFPDLENRNYSGDAKGHLQLLNDAGATAIAPANYAAAYAAVGDREKTFEHWQRAYSEQDTELFCTIRFPAFDPLRRDLRYKDMMRKLALPE